MIAHAAAYDYPLAWFDRNGAPAGPLGAVRRVTVGLIPRISPNGSRVVVQINDVKTQNQDLWLGDALRGHPRTADYDVAPDGRILVGTVVGPSKGTLATTILNWPKATTR